MPIEKSKDGVIIKVHVQPKSAKSGVWGIYGGSVKIKLNSPPVENRANEELVRFISSLMGIRKSDIKILRGTTGRKKKVFIPGISAREASSKLGL